MSLRLMLIGRVASGMNGLLGACMMVAPVVTGDISRHNPDVWVSLALGGIVMVLGMTRLISPEELPVLSWINLALGSCILLSPWLLRFASDEDQLWTAVTFGGTVMILAALSAKATLLVRQRSFRL
jgi:hypothetical protein